MTGSGVNKKLQALKFLYPSFDTYCNPQ